ncbi:MAG: hypothetical protein Q9181_006427 [Wetmoreana brouardii]
MTNIAGARVEELSLELRTKTSASNKVTKAAWLNYISGPNRNSRKWLLNDDFPQLKRLTIDLKDSCLLASAERLQWLCSAVGETVRGLDWIHVIGLTNPELDSPLKPLFSLLKPTVCKNQSDAADGEGNSAYFYELKTVQAHITAYEHAVDWANVTLWRGCPTCRPPFIPDPKLGQVFFSAPNVGQCPEQRYLVSSSDSQGYEMFDVGFVIA